MRLQSRYVNTIPTILYMHLGASLPPAAAATVAEAPLWDVTDSPGVAEEKSTSFF